MDLEPPAANAAATQKFVDADALICEVHKSPADKMTVSVCYYVGPLVSTVSAQRGQGEAAATSTIFVDGADLSIIASATALHSDHHRLQPQSTADITVLRSCRAVIMPTIHGVLRTNNIPSRLSSLG